MVAGLIAVRILAHHSGNIERLMGIQFNPYDTEVYRQLTKIYFTLNEPKKGWGAFGHGVQRFP